MDEQRNRLIKLLQRVDDMLLMMRSYDECADFLIENGIIVPPCKIGDMVYRVVENGSESFIKEDRVKKVNYEDGEWILTLEKYLMCGFIGCNIFLTRDEAEKTLKECVENG